MDYQSSAPVEQNYIVCRRNLRPVITLNENNLSKSIVIGITVHNQKSFVRNALLSAIEQTAVLKGLAAILILDDQSVDDWRNHCIDLLEHAAIDVIEGHCGSPARARNALLDFVDEHYSSTWVCRLDADDKLATSYSVEKLCAAGDAKNNINFILGSNLLEKDGALLNWENTADKKILLNKRLLHKFVKSFCIDGEQQELPSCNLILRTCSKYRYPNIKSAEDHWLVAQLLSLHQAHGLIVSAPSYAVYSLSGNETRENKICNSWNNQRHRLAFALRYWCQYSEKSDNFLGAGHEGVVWREQQYVHKRFYPWAMSNTHVERLKTLLPQNSCHIPSANWYFKNDDWHYKYRFETLWPVGKFLDQDAVIEFLSFIYISNIATLNMKRDNLMLNKQGQLVLIDIGKDIVPLTVSRFLDISARLYSFGILGWSDEETVRRESTQNQDEALAELPGFKHFYTKLIHKLSLFSKPAKSHSLSFKSIDSEFANDTSLLIKSCAQDADLLYAQVVHIVTQLSHPKRFKDVVLLVDNYEGPFLRQYAPPNLPKLLDVAAELTDSNLIDRIILTPSCREETKAVYHRWFNNKTIYESHTTKMAPLFSQLWAFEQIQTRYVLQCDCDVLIGRKDFKHDFLADMQRALKPLETISVGFNIPQRQRGFNEYHAEQDGNPYPPEVRFCLLDLERLDSKLPIQNPVENHRFTLTWHRAVEQLQRETGTRSLRGGDSRSFYIHPLNEDKPKINYSMTRDLISQGHYPTEQAGHFDLIPGRHWNYPCRSEDIIFLLKGRDTPLCELQLCLASLTSQSVQNFGIVVIDDGINCATSWTFPSLLQSFEGRYTLIRRESNVGRIPNFITAIKEICRNPESLIVALDLDDTLMDKRVVQTLQEHVRAGKDLIQMPMFRPDKPLKQYYPDYETPRTKGGANVWSHLRAFKKKLFEAIPENHLKYKGKWIEQVTDYTTMVPMAELAKAPIFDDSFYAYYHKREVYSESKKSIQKELLNHIFSLENLSSSSQVEIKSNEY